MHPAHRITVALVLAVAAVAGLFGLTRTLDLGAGAATVAHPNRLAVAHRQRQLQVAEHALRRALERRTPPLPRLPHYSDPPPAPASASASAPAPAPTGPPQRVVYVRPPPHVVTVHRAGGGERDGGEGRGAGGGDD